MLPLIETLANTVKYQLGKVDSAGAFGLHKWLVNRTGHQLLNVLLSGKYETKLKNRQFSIIYHK